MFHCVYHILENHLSVNGHFTCLHNLAVVDSAAVNTEC